MGAGLDRSRFNFLFSNTGGAQYLSGLLDVTISSPATNDILRYNGAVWTNYPISSIGLTSINGLTDPTQIFQVGGTNGVTLTITSSGTKHTFTTILTAGIDQLSDVIAPGPTANQWLTYGTTAWIPEDKLFDNLSDVVITAASAGDYPRYNGTTWVNTRPNSVVSGSPKIVITGGSMAVLSTTPVTIDLGSVALDDLSDVVIAGPVSGQILNYSGSNWANVTAGNVVAADAKIVVTGGNNAIAKTAPVTIAFGTVVLDDLSDVVITTPANGELLKYNGSNWVNGGSSDGSDIITTTVVTTSVATVDFTGVSSQTYKTYHFWFSGVTGDNASSSIRVSASSNMGSTYDVQFMGGISIDGGAGITGTGIINIPMGNAINLTTTTTFGNITILNSENVSVGQRCKATVIGGATGDPAYGFVTSVNAVTINAWRFSAGAGNIVGGIFTLIGER